ncbi:hypothetical protein B0O99DRAFT_526359 [Bisporella sp. PMI_857]|nr:hypothetical protein B0O99DRAFT_526359 [Bisporella sp. PMI_857]
MRAYRACLNCRGRKSKCDLDINGGRPPCRRCQREARECILGESHRGGRRVRKKPKIEGDTPANTTPSNPNTPKDSSLSSPALVATSYSPLPGQQSIRPNLQPAQPYQRASFHENIASAKLQNPSDALEILAQVADQAEEGDSGSEPPGQSLSNHPALRLQPNGAKIDDYIHYKPVYEQYHHPYFPIIPRETFNRAQLPWLSQREPHLFAAILTVASKDDERIHQICYDHMKELVLMIAVGAEVGVEAVEAMLLLSQWVSHRSQASVAVGRGEEDRVAWMYIGTAVRLAYYLGIDRTAFKSEVLEDPTKFHRSRLVWLACYLCDRQVSVRLGKAFWSRGPGPLSGMKANDFPTLKPLAPGDEDRASIFQANLELTQIFSNCHDILYASKGNGWKEMLEGRYAKYIDDFRASIRNWNRTWGHLIGSPPAKPSLLLTFDYLRLYVNAFAYQATIARAVLYPRDKQHNSSEVMPLIDASAPDARFIYESLDAAKDLLAHFNSFVDIETLRYMPTLYYLYIVYSAVFLYKARATTTMTNDERISVRRTVQSTIDRLHKANHMGSRYARLLQMLWRKAPKIRDPPQVQIDPRLQQQYEIQVARLSPFLIPLHNLYL